jgi:hypothetical protein
MPRSAPKLARTRAVLASGLAALADEGSQILFHAVELRTALHRAIVEATPASR